MYIWYGVRVSSVPVGSQPCKHSVSYIWLLKFSFLSIKVDLASYKTKKLSYRSNHSLVYLSTAAVRRQWNFWHPCRFYRCHRGASWAGRDIGKSILRIIPFIAYSDASFVDIVNGAFDWMMITAYGLEKRAHRGKHLCLWFLSDTTHLMRRYFFPFYVTVNPGRIPSSVQSHKRRPTKPYTHIKGSLCRVSHS